MQLAQMVAPIQGPNHHPPARRAGAMSRGHRDKRAELYRAYEVRCNRSGHDFQPCLRHSESAARYSRLQERRMCESIDGALQSSRRFLDSP